MVSHRNLIAALCLVIFVSLVAGCDSNRTENVNQKSYSSGIPKLDCHKPESLAVAIARLDELFQSIEIDQPLPEDLTYTVVKVTHGTGASAHSHFHQIEEGKEIPTSDHDDHGGNSEESRHEVSVDVFTEFEDIVRWLPAIAADSEITRDDWKVANQFSLDLQTTLRPVSDIDSHSDMREFFRANADEFKTALDGLKALQEKISGKDQAQTKTRQTRILVTRRINKAAQSNSGGATPQPLAAFRKCFEG